MAVAHEGQLDTGLLERDRQWQPCHGRRLGDLHGAGPRAEPLGQRIEPGQRRAAAEVVHHLAGPTGLGTANHDVMVGHYRGVDPNRHCGTTLVWSHSRVLLSVRGPPAPLTGARRRSSSLMGGPTSALIAPQSSAPAPLAKKRRPPPR